MGNGASVPAKLDKHAAPPADWIKLALAADRPIPDEIAGAYCPELYHGNTTGAAIGFASEARCTQWLESNKAELAKCGTWKQLNIHAIGADWAMQYGKIDGHGFPFKELKPMLEEERATMVEGYEAAVKTARDREPDAYATLITDKRYASRRPKKGTSDAAVQKVDTITEVFEGALGSLPRALGAFGRGGACPRRRRVQQD